MARFRKKTRIGQDIPTGPMADISFLLIIFFMVTTVFVVYRGFAVELPEAGQIDALKLRRNVTNVWIGSDGHMMVDEYDVSIDTLGGVVSRKLTENPRIVVMIKSDRATPYRIISDVIEELKKVNALRVSFIAVKE
jgi:biopolymer transport protein ExbD